jgi:hypothetical protein
MKKYRKPTTGILQLAESCPLMLSLPKDEGGNASGHGNPPLDTRQFEWDENEEWE